MTIGVTTRIGAKGNVRFDAVPGEVIDAGDLVVVEHIPTGEQKVGEVVVVADLSTVYVYMNPMPLDPVAWRVVRKVKP